MITSTFRSVPRPAEGSGDGDAEISVSLFPAAGAGEAVAVLTHPFSTIPACHQQVSSTTQP